ncbi:MAG TPA: Panacea domain-containing protein [Bauldia sp.]|nr:Panacea domain-containing protein [Bauldia sp.]
MTFDKEKFNRLVHYVVWKAGSHPGFGATKLNKVLWFAEGRVFTLTGKPIAGATYVREKFGPVPRQIMQARTELVAEGAIKITKNERQYENTQFMALYKPDVSMFSGVEMQAIDYWTDYIDKQHTATSISERSHDYVWQIAKMGEELPLYVYRVNRIPEPTDEDVERLKRRAKELGLG